MIFKNPKKKNSKKTPKKKCKIWSPNTFQYGYHVERFGSTVWTLTTTRKGVKHQMTCALQSTLA